MLTSNFLRNLSSSYERLGKYQEQLETGKKINRPSDDPVVALMGMKYRTEVNHIEQYTRNLSTAYSWMDSSDDALSQATDVLQRIKELVTEASNDTYSDGDREDAEKEIEQLKHQLESIANTTVAGKYIFNGTATSEKPVDLATSTFSQNQDAVKVKVSEGVEIQINTDTTNVFGEELFQDINDLQQALQNGSSSQEVGDFLSKIQRHLDQVTAAQAELGARQNRVDMMKDRLDGQMVTAKKILSDNEDADMEKVITNLITQESVHRAALAAGARIIQPTLMDFLR
jgi:flagellar hook-associated protein 3 FlgL